MLFVVLLLFFLKWIIIYKYGYVIMIFKVFFFFKWIEIYKYNYVLIIIIIFIVLICIEMFVIINNFYNIFELFLGISFKEIVIFLKFRYLW